VISLSVVVAGFIFPGVVLPTFIFPTQAHAAWGGTNVNCTGTDCTKSGGATNQPVRFLGGNDNSNLTIMQGADVNVANTNTAGAPIHAIYVGYNWRGQYAGGRANTLTNNANIQTTGARGGNVIYIRDSSIASIINNGTMVWSGNHHGITAQDRHSALIFNFTNHGTIGSAQTLNAGLYVGGKANITVTNFVNTGQMLSSSSGAGVNVGSRGTIQNFSNTGNISAIITTGGTIGQLNNEGQIGIINVNNGSINTLTNSGTNSKVGTMYIRNNSNMQNINVMQGAEITTLYTRSSNINNLTLTVAGNGSKIGTIQNSNGGTLGGTITINNDGKIDNIINANTMNATVINNTANAINVNNSGTWNANANITSQGAVNLTNTSAMTAAVTAGGKLTVQNSGQLQGRLTSDNIDITNTTTGQITQAIDTMTLKLTNAGNLNQTITANSTEITNTGTIAGAVTSNGATTINNAGTMSGNISTNNARARVANTGTISGALSVMQGAEIINNGTISGQITGNNLTIQNQANGTITQDLTTQNLSLTNSGNLTNNITTTGNSNTINNSGQMSGDITASNARITNNANAEISGALSVSGNSQITNNTDAVIKSISSSGATNVENQGTISEGIKVTSGTLNLHQGHDATLGKDPTSQAHIEVSSGGRANVNEWHLDALEYDAANRDKALQIKGDSSAVTLRNVIVAGAVDSTDGTPYNSNTFVNNVDSNTFVGNDTAGGAGIDVNSIRHISGLYNFLAADDVGKGYYRVAIDRKELSGETISTSSVFSTRFRSITVANIVRSLQFKNFDLDENASVNNAFLAAQRRDEDNLAFAYGYLGMESINVEAGRVKGYIRGLMGGALKNLKDDKGVLGLYVGYDNADRYSNSQHLKVEERTKYAGASYYTVLKRKNDDEYYLNVNSRLDLGKIGADKENQVSGETASTSYRNVGVNMSAKLGANYADDEGKMIISHEVGLNYQALRTGAFSFHHSGGVTEHYDRGNMHFVDVIVATSMRKPLSDKVRVNATLGSMIKLYEHARTKSSIYNIQSTTGTRQSANSTISTSKWYAYTQAGVSWSFTPNVDVSLNYSGVLSEDNAYSHNKFLQVGIWW